MARSAPKGDRANALHELAQRLQKPLGRTVGSEGRVSHELWGGSTKVSAPGAAYLVLVPARADPSSDRPSAADKWNEDRALNIELLGVLTRLLDSEDQAEVLAGKMFLRAACRLAASRNENPADFLLDAPELEARVIDRRKRSDVLDYAERGYDLRTICARAMISRATLALWRAEDPDFNLDFENAAGKRSAELQESMLRVAIGDEDHPGDGNLGYRILAAQNPEEWAQPEATSLAREQVSRAFRAFAAVTDGDTVKAAIAIFRGAPEPIRRITAAESGAFRPVGERDRGQPALGPAED